MLPSQSASSASWDMDSSVSSPIRINVASSSDVDESSPAVLSLELYDSSTKIGRDSDTEEEQGESVNSQVAVPVPKVDYLPAIFHWASYLGLNSVCRIESGKHWTCSVFLKVVFATISAVSILQGLVLLRSTSNVKGSEPSQYVLFGYFLAVVLTRLMFIGHQLFKRRNIDNLLNVLTKRGMGNGQGFQTKSTGVACLLLLLSIGTSVIVLGSGFGIDLPEWNWKNILISHVDEMRWFLNLTPLNVTNAVEFEMLDYFLGCLGVMGEVCGRLVDDFILDLLLVSSITVAEYGQWLMNLEFAEDAACSNANNVGREFLHSQQFISEVATSINDALGTLFKLSHVNNLVLCAYFIHEALVDKDVGVLLLLSVRIAKVFAIFCIANRATRVNGYIRNVIKVKRRTWFSSMDSCEIQIILDDLCITPFGIGLGSFLIEETFVAKFVGVVISYFFILVDSKDRMPCEHKDT